MSAPPHEAKVSVTISSAIDAADGSGSSILAWVSTPADTMSMPKLCARRMMRVLADRHCMHRIAAARLRACSAPRRNSARAMPRRRRLGSTDSPISARGPSNATCAAPASERSSS
jgi:hypothetical protein